MCTTRSRTSSLAVVLLSSLTVSPWSLLAGTVLVPIVSRAQGENDAAWNTEVRVTNRTDLARQFSIVDWIGTPGWSAATYTVAPHSTISLGGQDISGSLSAPAFGLAICDADSQLLVQSAVLAGIWAPSIQEPCPSYDGGGGLCSGESGAGPIVDGLVFANPGQEIFVPWLHTVSDRRTNLVMINPDGVSANVTVAVTSQDGSSTVTASLVLPPRSYNQITDLFSESPWSAIALANSNIRFGGGGAAFATVTGDTRLLAMAYVISNNNNSLTIALPR